MSTPTHLLILGTARGGTTLLATVLGAHPMIACLDEDLTGAFDRVVGGKIRAVKLCVPNHVELTRRWQPVFTPGLWFGAVRKTMAMNRVPRSRLSIMDLLGLGDVQCVLLLRDPRAVIGALGRRENRVPRVAAYRWRRSVEVAAALVDRAGDRPPVIVEFDRLVREPETVLRGICDRLSLSFSPEMLKGPTLNTRYPAAGFDAVRTGTAGHDDIPVEQLVPQAVLERWRALIAESV